MSAATKRPPGRPRGCRSTNIVSIEGLAQMRLNAARAREVKRLREIPADPIPADFATVAAWAAERGVRWTCWDDLPGVNAARDAERVARFQRAWPVKGRRG